MLSGREGVQKSDELSSRFVVSWRELADKGGIAGGVAVGELMDDEDDENLVFRMSASSGRRLKNTCAPMRETMDRCLGIAGGDEHCGAAALVAWCGPTPPLNEPSAALVLLSNRGGRWAGAVAAGVSDGRTARVGVAAGGALID